MQFLLLMLWSLSNGVLASSGPDCPYFVNIDMADFFNQSRPLLDEPLPQTEEAITMVAIKLQQSIENLTADLKNPQMDTEDPENFEIIESLKGSYDEWLDEMEVYVGIENRKELPVDETEFPHSLISSETVFKKQNLDPHYVLSETMLGVSKDWQLLDLFRDLLMDLHLEFIEQVGLLTDPNILPNYFLNYVRKKDSNKNLIISTQQRITRDRKSVV